MELIIILLIVFPAIIVLSLLGLKRTIQMNRRAFALKSASPDWFRDRSNATSSGASTPGQHRLIRSELKALPISRIGRFTGVLGLVSIGMMLFAGYQVWAANPDGDLRIEVVAAYNFIVDSNVESPSTYAPEAATVGAYVCNDGANDLTDVFVYIGDFDPNGDTNPADSTPGIYASRTHTGLTGTFSLVHEGGSAGTRDATRYLTTIPAGECITQYWVISYPRLDDNGNSVTGGIKPDDDLWLEYDIWATADDGGSSLLADQTRKATMRNEISASANKIWPNGDNKVPDEYKQAIQDQLGWDTITPSGGDAAYPGELVSTKGIWYDFGVAVHGFDNNLDLVPDQNAWAQPVGDPSNYDPGCFRLVHTYGLIIVKLKSGGEYLIPFEDQLYFENLPDNTGVVGLVFYEYEALNGVCTAGLTPYQEVASGFDNEKFNGDYGHFVPPLNSFEPTVELNKSVDQTSIGPTLPATLTYSLQFTNTGVITVGQPQYAAPMVAQDSVPDGTIYVAGSAAANNTSPPSVSGYNILYSTDNGASWTTTEPAAASVTNIQWWLTDPLPPGEGGIATFQVTVPSTYTGAVVNNVSGLSYGNTETFTNDDATTLIAGINDLGDTVFADDGSSGGTAGNGVQDGSEAGIPDVTVSLFYDADADGTGDYLIATTTTSITGSYSFSNLPDSNFVVVVDTVDPDLPTGYSSTTETSISVDLDSSGGTSSPVSYLNADFGFSPALTVEKTLISGSPAYEGREVQYTIGVSNLLPDGSFETDYWARSAIVGTQFTNENGVIGAPFDGQLSSQSSAWPQFSGSDPFLDMVKGTGYVVPQCGPITKIEAIYQLKLNGALADDQLRGLIRFNGVDWYDFIIPTASTTGFTATNGALYTVDMTTSNTGHTGSVIDWATWDNSPANEIQLGIVGEKQSSADNKILYVDAIGVRITNDGTVCSSFTSDTVLNPVPLTDTYDPAKLEYVSASFAPSTISTATGVITWTNVGPLNPGDTKTITLTFKGLEPAGNTSETITNTATVTNALFANGLPANGGSDDAVTTLTPTGSISGVIWSEGSGGTTGWNGSTGYEAGNDFFVPGVTVTLYACTNGSGTPLDPAAVSTTKTCTSVSNGGAWEMMGTTTTDANGGYLFEGLLGGFYYVTVDSASIPGAATQTAEAGSDDTNQNGTGRTCGTCDHQWGDPIQNLNTSFFNPIDTAGETITNVNFGYSVNPALYGELWTDNDGDGLRETGEDTFGAGITVTLTDDLGNVVTTTTDANGGYLFENLFTGRTYTVTVDTNDLPGTGWTNTADPDGTTDGVYVVGTLAAGEVSGSHDFGFYQTGTASIGDTLYYDWDIDGVQDSGEEGVPGITVYLYEDSDGDGVIDPGDDALITTATTSISGTYLFSNLPPGDYIVTTDIPANTIQTGDPDEAGLCQTCDLQGVVSGLSSGVSIDTIDFGYVPFGDGSIGDTVWYDKNGDGAQSGAQETGLASITVVLWIDYNGDGIFSPVLTTTTDASGNYLFENLPDGNYEVRVDTSDPDLPDDAFGNSYVPTTATTVTATLSSGSTYLDADFGFTALGAIGDTIYWDANGDGEYDWNESGIPGVVITLTNASTQTITIDGVNYAPGAIISTTTTGANGTYLFQGLPPGDYGVEVDTTGSINGATLTGDPEADGVPCTDLSATGCDNQTTVTLIYGTNYMGADFGYQAPGAFGDYVWFDQNGDGVQDGGEIGIANLVVTATTTADVTVNGVNYPTGTTITTTTDYDGYYSFDNLISNGSNATWTVTVQTPANMTPTFDPDGSLDTTSTVTIDTNGDVVTVGGTNCANCALTVDFGFEMDGPYSLSGAICLEDKSSTNGVCGDGTDTQVATYTVHLYNDSGQYLGSTTTDASGAYTFTNLIDDIYYVSIGTTLIPLDVAALTTTVADTPASAITETAQTVYQTVAVNAATAGSDGGLDANQVENVDFAFVSTVDYDYGDLPQTYNTTLEGNPSGPRHTVSQTPTLYLGSIAPDSESNGVPSVDADADGSDEDGVVPINPAAWTDGANGGSVRITVNGSGWLIGWIDFNDDTDFTDSGDLIVSQAVSSGVYTVTFDIPAGTISGGNTDFYSRFRLFESAPPVPVLAYTGAATNGEVEDYLLTTTPTYAIGDYIWLDVDGDGIQGTDAAEKPIAGVVVDLYDSAGSYITSTTTLIDGSYTFADLTASLTYTIQLSSTNFLNGGTLFDYLSTTLGAGTAATDSDADPNVLFKGVGYAVTTTLTTADDLTIDFGFQPTVDLALSKIVNNSTPNVGDTITFTISISNSGVYTASDVQVSDPLPAGLGYLSDTPGQGIYTNSIGVWNVGVVPTNTTITLTIIATVTNAGTITNTAQVSTTNLPDRDSTPDNDLENEDDQDSVVLMPQQIDLSLSKTADNTTSNVGDTITFTIVISNAGPNDATNVVVADPLPGEVGFISADPSQGSYNDATGLWAVGTITSSTTVTLTVVVTVTSAGPFTNTAEVTAVDQFDPDSTPNNDDAAEDDQGSVMLTGQAPGSIGDTVFIDGDGDGQFDAGEGISGITVTLTLPGGSTLTDVTDGSGQYSFPNLPAGTYTVTISTGGTPLAGLPNTVDPDGGNDSTATVTLTAGQDNPDQDFGYFEPLRIGSQIWHDLNNDGDLDSGEPGVAGVEVDLYRQTGPGYTLVVTTSSTAGGFYEFTDLPNGTYYVNLPAGDFDEPGDPLFSYLSSTPTASASTDVLDNNDNGNNNLDPTAGGISTAPFVLTANALPTGETDEDGLVPDNDSDLTIDFGVFELLSLGNRVWFDANNNGIIDPGESGIPGVVVNLLQPNGSGNLVPVLDPGAGQPRTATTNANGIYFFDRLEPGEYVIQIDPVNFQTGGILENYFSSEGNVDPDDDVNGDDNGRDEDEPELYGIFSDPVTVTYYAEPINDDDSNSNTNFSVDFGLQLTPTAIDLLTFTSHSENGQVRLEWATAVEYDNFGFRLLRSETGQLADVVEIAFIPGQGQGTASGATYTFLDETVAADQTYTYWLVDVDFNGIETIHSETTSISTGSANLTPIYLPLIAK